MAYKKAKNHSKKAELVVNIICIVGGLLFIILGGAFLAKQNKYVETKAVITDIQSEYNHSSDSYDYDVYVTYTVDGHVYTELLGEYKSSYDVGDEISIKYDSDNPKIIVSGSPLSGIIMLAFGALFFILGLVQFINALRYNKKDKENGVTDSNSDFNLISDPFAKDSDPFAKNKDGSNSSNPFDAPDPFAKNTDKQEVYRDDMVPHEDVFSDEVKFEHNISDDEIK